MSSHEPQPRYQNKGVAPSSGSAISNYRGSHSGNSSTASYHQAAPPAHGQPYHYNQSHYHTSGMSASHHTHNHHYSQSQQYGRPQQGATLGPLGRSGGGPGAVVVAAYPSGPPSCASSSTQPSPSGYSTNSSSPSISNGSSLMTPPDVHAYGTASMVYAKSPEVGVLGLGMGGAAESRTLSLQEIDERLKLLDSLATDIDPTLPSPPSLLPKRQPQKQGHSPSSGSSDTPQTKASLGKPAAKSANAAAAAADVRTIKGAPQVIGAKTTSAAQTAAAADRVKATLPKHPASTKQGQPGMTKPKQEQRESSAAVAPSPRPKKRRNTSTSNDGIRGGVTRSASDSEEEGEYVDDARIPPPSQSNKSHKKPRPSNSSNRDYTPTPSPPPSSRSERESKASRSRQSDADPHRIRQAPSPPQSHLPPTRSWDSQKFCDVRDLYKTVARKLKHRGDDHINAANGQDLPSDQRDRSRAIGSLEHTEAILLYIYGFWCEEQVSGIPRTFIADNWASLYGLLRYTCRNHERNGDMALVGLCQLLEGLIMRYIVTNQQRKAQRSLSSIAQGAAATVVPDTPPHSHSPAPNGHSTSSRANMHSENSAASATEIVASLSQISAMMSKLVAEEEESSNLLTRSRKHLSNAVLSEQFPDTWHASISSKMDPFRHAADLDPASMRPNGWPSTDPPEAGWAWPIDGVPWPHAVCFGKALLRESAQRRGLSWKLTDVLPPTSDARPDERKR